MQLITRRVRSAAALAALTSAAALMLVGPLTEASARPPAASPRPIVLLVHGRGVIARDSASMRTAWLRSLQSGALGLAKRQILGADDVRLVWYADVLDPDAGRSCAATSNFSAEGDPGVRGIASFMSALLTLGAELGEGTGRDEMRGFAADLLYVSDAERRCAAAERLDEAVESAARAGRPVIMVAHSFGAIVAYDYLRARASDAAPVVSLVTTGSMLGSPEVRRILFGDAAAGPLALPRGVGSWINVRDTRDPLAAPISPAAARAPIQEIVIDDSTTIDPHEAPRYLRDPATARAILSAWCGAGRDPDPGCRSIAQPRR